MYLPKTSLTLSCVKGEQEELHLYVTAFSEQSLEKAKTLAGDLLKHVKDEYLEFVKNRSAAQPPSPYGRGGPVAPGYPSPYGGYG